jgi:hypothetical protein
MLHAYNIAVCETLSSQKLFTGGQWMEIESASMQQNVVVIGSFYLANLKMLWCTFSMQRCVRGPPMSTLCFIVYVQIC